MTMPDPTQSGEPREVSVEDRREQRHVKAKDVQQFHMMEEAHLREQAAIKLQSKVDAARRDAVCHLDAADFHRDAAAAIEALEAERDDLRDLLVSREDDTERGFRSGYNPRPSRTGR